MLETPARIEPLFFYDAVPTVLADLAIELQKAAADSAEACIRNRLPNWPISCAS